LLICLHAIFPCRFCQLLPLLCCHMHCFYCRCHFCQFSPSNSSIKEQTNKSLICSYHVEGDNLLAQRMGGVTDIAPACQTALHIGHKLQRGQVGFSVGCQQDDPLRLSRMLGPPQHPIRECNSARTWDNKHSTVSKRVKGDLLLQQDDIRLCVDWQRRKGCESRLHDQKHLCSGCTQRSHGAQTCSRAQK
jgi:hypothetical protein